MTTANVKISQLPPLLTMGNATIFPVVDGGNNKVVSGTTLRTYLANTGVRGYTGSAGQRGATGPSGPAGSNGARGATGATGIGATGSSGPRGYTGSAGTGGGSGNALINGESVVSLNADGNLTIPGNIHKTTDLSIVVGDSVVNFAVEDVDSSTIPPSGVWRLFFNDSDYPTLGTTVQIGDTVTTSWGTPLTVTIVDIQQDSGSWQIHVDQDITVGFNNYNTVTFSSISSKTWTFGYDGTLTVPGAITMPDETGLYSPGHNLYITAGNTTGCSVPGGDTIISSGLGYGGVANGGGNVTLRTGDYHDKVWNFDYNGNLTLPAGGDILDSTGYSVLGLPSSLLINEENSFTLEANGKLTLPGGGVINNESVIVQNPPDTRTSSFSTDYAIATPDIIDNVFVAVPINPDSLWFANNFVSITNLFVTFADATTQPIVACYNGTSQGTPAILVQWQNNISKAAGDIWPVTLTGTQNTQHYSSDTTLSSDNTETTSWLFENTGRLWLPSGANSDVKFSTIRTDGAFLNLDVQYNSSGNIYGGARAGTNGTDPFDIVTDFTDAHNTWRFGGDGTITFPDSSVQTTAYTGTYSVSNIVTRLQVAAAGAGSGSFTEIVNSMYNPAVSQMSNLDVKNNANVDIDGNGDDAFIAIELPFTVTFAGGTYGNVFLGSNGYLTFTDGNADYGNNWANPILPTDLGLPGILVMGGDDSWQNVYAYLDTTGGAGNGVVVIRWEGNSLHDANSPNGPGPGGWTTNAVSNRIFEILLYEAVAGQFDIRVITQGGQAEYGDVAQATDGTNWLLPKDPYVPFASSYTAGVHELVNGTYTVNLDSTGNLVMPTWTSFTASPPATSGPTIHFPVYGFESADASIGIVAAGLAVRAADQTWTFGTDGQLSLAGNVKLPFPFPYTGYVVVDSTNTTVPGATLLLGGEAGHSPYIISTEPGRVDNPYGKSILIQGSKAYGDGDTAGGDVTIAAGYASGGTGAKITVYGGGGESSPGPSRGNVDIVAGYDLGSVDDPTYSLTHGGYYHGGQINLRTSGYNGADSNQWSFDVYGNITFPDSSVQTTAYTGAIIGSTGGTPSDGSLWYDTTDGRTYVRVSGTWVDAAPQVLEPVSTYLGNLTVEDTTIFSDLSGWTFGTDGNLTLPAGGDIVNSTGASVLGGSVGIGINQTWQDMTSGRAFDTEYTNSTSLPIMVSAGGVGGNTGQLRVFVGVSSADVLLSLGATNSGYTMFSFVVPPGHKYKITTNNSYNGGLVNWAELR